MESHICKPCRMEPQMHTKQRMASERRVSNKKSWDEEMIALFCDYNPASPPRRIRAPRETEPRLFRIWDVSQKFLILMNNILVATSRDSMTPEELLAVLPNHSLDPTLQPIFLGLNDKTHTLSCMESGDGEPLLNLVERNILDLYSSHEESKSFTFYSRSNNQQQTCCFESAAFPGWFMSTSTEINKPVRLSREGGPDITNFYCERKDPLE
ncbi:interleukin-36 receptor antagonist protein [Anolis carolinensis]|uniref:interleukin-36 receptor antagonist protein n=1 Tax=Anolis carolinensis TaxID=28377 RepID=UPI002F2B67BB